MMKQKLKQVRAHLWQRVAVRTLQLLESFPLANRHHLYLPHLEATPAGARILVIAPHFDDETLGPGGTLLKHIQAGAVVKVLFFTDGSLGGDPEVPSERLVETRKQEALAATRFLGIQELEFLDFPDKGIAFSEQSVQRISKLIIAFSPDIVYLPFPIDYHVDHVMATRVTTEAALRVGTRATPYCYESVVPIIPNVLVDITEQVKTKEAAILLYASQMVGNDYLTVITQGLNQFRTHGLLKGKGAAEAFFKTDWKFLNTLLKNLYA